MAVQWGYGCRGNRRNESSKPPLGCREDGLACRSCGSENQTQFGAEINIHFPELTNPDKPTVLVFPKLVVCMDCGFTEFAIQATELRLLGGRRCGVV
jgi:hypothetical protein